MHGTDLRRLPQRYVLTALTGGDRLTQKNEDDLKTGDNLKMRTTSKMKMNSK